VQFKKHKVQLGYLGVQFKKHKVQFGYLGVLFCIRINNIKVLFILYIMQQICSECNKTFSNKKGLLKHRRNIHEIYCKEKQRKRDETTNCYKCKYCTKEYTISQSRWSHEKICSERIKQQSLAAEMERIKLENDV